MKIAWATRSFLDYRVPVYEELNRLVNNNLAVVYCADVIPDRVRTKINNALGENAIGLTGEFRLAGKKVNAYLDANKSVRIPYQPGLVKTLRRLEPDVLVSDGFFQWTHAALWLRARKKIPHVMCYERTAHTERNAQWFRTAYRKFAMRWIDTICCTGKLCGEYVQSLGFPKEKITYGHMAANLAGLRKSIDKVTDDQLLELKGKHDLRGTVFLYVGSLIPRKGVMELLNAWKSFEAGISRDKATLLLAGDGRQRGELDCFVRENRLQGVRFAGSVDYDSLPLYYKVADAFVIATLEDNWSLVVPEAMACGLPILSSKYNGCFPELVRPGNGWVFDPHDATDLASTLNHCLSIQERLSEMGQESRHIVSEHTTENAAGAILNACRIATQKLAN